MKTKKIMLSLMIASLSLLSYSAEAQVNNMQQDSARNRTQNENDMRNNDGRQSGNQDNNSQHLKTDHVMMQNGKMMVVKDGNMMPMEKDMTLRNGTKCMVDGTCMTKDGKKTMMKEGEMMDMDGKMMTVSKKDKKLNKEY